ncbi:hypothetical protein GCM10011487_41900 [Steroidobacter agaridevorans]|uniref:DUF4198 domain-containing protein n=1 Tax=Steroidobacter agaridevorans TaxID=2695856 RepID=A0A829YG43_9GAMM|nr:DUF4198 domain-containing protein [Steroidobacter agaridevorans]GFE82190.1 hypothetical protein GCM10011487_41900 [Steroidobacter agaridevorans]
MKSCPGIVTTALLAGFVLASSAHAHDFWIQPQAYWSQANASIPITLQVGHGAERQRSQIRSGRIARVVAFAPDGAARDMHADLHLRGASDDGHLHFETSGTYVVVLETDNRGRSALPAQRFNKYAQQEGLTPALDYRQRMGKMATDAAESYRRVTKAIVQVGTAATQSGSHITSPLGLPLEIVPERNPYAASGSDLPVRVYFEGQPLAGALVKLTRLEHDDVPVEERRTDSSGRARFSLTRNGNWLLNVVWTEPVTAPSEVDFDTIFSSLTFGFP